MEAQDRLGQLGGVLVGGRALGAQRGNVGVDPRCRGARAVTGQVGEVQPVEGVFGVAVGVVVRVGRRFDVVEQVELLAGLGGG